MAMSNMPDDLKTSGGWFFGKYAVEIFTDYNNIQNDMEIKVQLAKRIFIEAESDSKLSGTIKRVNAVLRIIENNQFEYCLQYVAKSKRIKREDVIAAKDALAMIEYGIQKQKSLI